MLSLVWSISALILMRRATRLQQARLWQLGAALLAIVVAKLFLVDQSDAGSATRIVAFVGVGLLMVAIGYLAPYPKAPAVAVEDDGDPITPDLNNDGKHDDTQGADNSASPSASGLPTNKADPS
jgi:amino acid permease